jgi:peptidyl-prolyl cis-trans isomerase D
MLERIREGSQGTWATVILGLVILSFAFAGIGSYVNSSINSAAASVNGQDISRDALEKAYQNERARMESQYGEAFAALASDTNYLNEFKRGVLDRLISEKLIDQAARELGLRVSDAQIKQAIVQMQEFQVDGKFDNDRYLLVLRQAGFQANGFRDYMRNDMVRRQLSKALIGTEFALTSEAQQAFDLQQQTRDIKYFTLDAKSFENEVNVADAEVEAYYQANITRFDTEQKVSVAYVELSLDDLLPKIQPSEQELEEFYQANIANYKKNEERRVAHILFEFGDDEAASLATAESVLAKVQAGEDFAALAKEYSADTFSAEKGGDLEWLSKGMMDPAFEDAAFNLAAVGDTSAVVKSEFGFHIIKLNDIKPEQVSSLAEVMDDVMGKIKTQKAEEELYALQQRLAEVAFENPDNLDEVAAVAGKPVVTTELFTRNNPPEALSDARALNAAFNDDLIEQALNSDVIDLGNNRLLVLRVVKNDAERTKALEEVSAEIKQQLTTQAAQAAARDWTQQRLSQLQAGEDITEQLATKSVVWVEQQQVGRNDAALGQNLLTELFKLSSDEQNNASVVDLLSGDVALVQLTKINPAPAAEANQLQNLQQRLASSRAQLVYGDLLASLKASADIEIHQIN